MKLENRLKQLETEMASMEEKRKIMTHETLALRSALIGFSPLISASSTAQYAAVKFLAIDRLASYLLAAEFPEEQAEEATAMLEDLFYEIDAARNAADQTPRMMS